MAAIDHTTIVFKNGAYIPKPFVFDEDWNCTSTLPFEYGRDGNITELVNSDGSVIDIRDSIYVFRDEYDAVFRRDGFKKMYGRKNIDSIVERLKWVFHKMELLCYEKEVGIWKHDNQEVYIYHEPLKQSYVSFYTDGTDSYVVIGGYGHYNNVYAHFMHRGYGDEFEEKMACEAFRWALTNVMEEIVDVIYPRVDIFELDNRLKDMQRKFGFEHKERKDSYEISSR